MSSDRSFSSSDSSLSWEKKNPYILELTCKLNTLRGNSTTYRYLAAKHENTKSTLDPTTVYMYAHASWKRQVLYGFGTSFCSAQFAAAIHAHLNRFWSKWKKALRRKFCDFCIGSTHSLRSHQLSQSGERKWEWWAERWNGVKEIPCVRVTQTELPHNFINSRNYWKLFTDFIYQLW